MKDLSTPKLVSRNTLIKEAKANLLNNGMPRFQMVFIMMLTGSFGFITSHLLLKMGVDHMGVRYAIATLTAYLALILMVGAWAKVKLRDVAEGVSHAAEVPLEIILNSGRWGRSSLETGKAAADASSSIGGSGNYYTSDSIGGGSYTSGSGDSFSVSDIIPVPDEGGLPVIVIGLLIAIALSVLFASGWLIYIAPNMMAEILIDSLVAGGIYKGLSKASAKHWIESVLSHTWKPFFGMMVLICVTGTALQSYYPEAHTLSNVIEVAQFPETDKEQKEEK